METPVDEDATSLGITAKPLPRLQGMPPLLLDGATPEVIDAMNKW